MLDAEDNISEGTGENFFLVKDNVLQTPDLDASLDGITRKTIIEIAKEKKIEVVIKKISLKEVMQSDEAFFTGTAAEVVPINSVNGQAIGDGKRGPLTTNLQSTYFDQVRGLREENASWHTYVS